MTYKTLDDFDFDGKTVFVRADLNVPTKDGQITDTTRIDRFVPTLKELIEKENKTDLKTVKVKVKKSSVIIVLFLIIGYVYLFLSKKVER